MYPLHLLLHLPLPLRLGRLPRGGHLSQGATEVGHLLHQGAALLKIQILNLLRAFFMWESNLGHPLQRRDELPPDSLPHVLPLRLEPGVVLRNGRMNWDAFPSLFKTLKFHFPRHIPHAVWAREAAACIIMDRWVV